MKMEYEKWKELNNEGYLVCKSNASDMIVCRVNAYGLVDDDIRKQIEKTYAYEIDKLAEEYFSMYNYGLYKMAHTLGLEIEHIPTEIGKYLVW